MAQMGYLGITIPEKYDGAGMTYQQYAIILEEITRMA